MRPFRLYASGYEGDEVYQKPDDAAYAPLVEAPEAVTVYTPTAFKALTRPELPAVVETVE
jgi:hypothetical protein